MNEHRKSKLSVVSRSGSRGARRGLAAAAIVGLTFIGLTFFGVGCNGGVALPEIGTDPYRGPALTVEGTGRQYIVNVEAPTPGWEITLDRTGEARDHREAYITLRTPSAAFVFPQVIVRQEVLTPIETRNAIRVYARVVPFDLRPAEGEYHFVTAAVARATPPHAAAPAGSPKPSPAQSSPTQPNPAQPAPAQPAPTQPAPGKEPAPAK